MIIESKTLEKYSLEVKKSLGLPHVLAKIQVEASADYARYSEMFADYEIRKARFMDSIKNEGQKPLSDKACENKWILEEDGAKWMFLYHYLRGLKQLTKAIDSATYVANQEAKNIQ